MGTDSVTITGHGDDAITIKGDHLHEEIDTYEDDVVLSFSDGTVLSFSYAGTGVWKATIHARGTANLTVVEAKDNSLDDLDWPDYTDQVTLGPVTWIERLDDPDTDEPAAVSRWEV